MSSKAASIVELDPVVVGEDGEAASPADPFAWLKQLDYDESFFVPYEWDNPARSAEFGLDGYTGSLTDWHELLQMTAPDADCGLVYVRGFFPDNAEAVIARVQREDHTGGKGTWGFQILPDSDVKLGDVYGQGLVNSRWPFLRHMLVTNEKEEESKEKVVEFLDGSYETISYTQEDTLYQVIRLAPGLPKEEHDSSTAEVTQEQQKPEGGKHEESLETKRQSLLQTQADTPEGPRQGRKLAFRVGGRVRFGCPCVNGTDDAQGNRYVTRCVNDLVSCHCVPYGWTLYMRVVVDGKPMDLTLSERASVESLANADISTKHEILLEGTKATVIVVSFCLKKAGVNDIIPLSERWPSSSDAANKLGINQESDEATNGIWFTALQQAEEHNATEQRAITTCVERIMCVSSIPTAWLSSHQQPSGGNIGSSPNTVGSSDTRLGSSDVAPVSGDIPNANHVRDKDNAPNSGMGEGRNDTHLLNSQSTGENETKSPDDSDGMQDNSSIPTLALICNLFTTQRIDMKSAFWQIRLLVKAYTFLGKVADGYHIQEAKSSTGDENKGLPKNYHTYRDKMKNHIRRLTTWLIAVIFEKRSILLPTLDGRSTRHVTDTDKHAALVDAFDACYRAMTIWYVLKYCPDILPLENDSIILLLKEQVTKFDTLDNLDGIKSKREDSSLKAALLLWYRRSCILQIQILLGLETGDAFEVHDLAKKAVKLSKKARQAPTDSYSADDELIDRLAILGEELLPKSARGGEECDICAREARNRILQRTKTNTFNPGTTKLKSGRVRTTAPWELSCLSHHSRLRTAVYRPEEVDIKAARDECFDFLSSDFTFLPTWDGSKKAMFGQWWDYDVSSIVCATLLDLKIKALEQKDSPARPVAEQNQKRGISPNPAAGALAARELAQKDQAFYELLEKQITLQNNIIDMLRKPTTNVMLSDFDWTKTKPARGQTYHPLAWVQSLDDTPEVFQEEQIKKVELRSEIKKYLHRKRKSEEVKSRTWTIENSGDLIPVEDILFLSFFDITLNEIDKFSVKRGGGRSVPVTYFYNHGNEPKNVFGDAPELDNPEPIESNGSLSLWSLYLDRHPEKYQHYERLPVEAQKVLNDPEVRVKILNQYHTELLSVLNDSLVDQDVRHRILFVQRCCPNLIEALIYIWHSDALDMIDSYFNPSSQFSNAKADMWTTSITISHWELKDPLLDPRFDEERTNPLVIPLGEKALRGKNRTSLDGDSGKIRFEETSSSLVITGDKQGLFWTCLVMSSQVDEDSMLPYSIALAKALTLFIHQQSSGRCLAFLILLGHLCVHIAKEYEHIIEVLMEKLSLGENVLLMGFDWEERDKAVYKLQKMIMCLEALRVFDDRLSSSLSKIQEAKETMVREITETKQELGRYHEELDQGYKNIIEEFDKRHSDISTLHIKIQQKIEQISRLRDAISSVTNVEDSRAAIKQNNNIRVLTYITIAYLPLGYVAALFSISDDFIPAHAGRTAYAWITLLFVFLTFVAAFSIEPVQAKWSAYQKRRTEHYIKEGALMDSNKDKENSENEKVKAEEEIGNGMKEGVKEKASWIMEGLRRRRKESPKDEEAVGGSVKTVADRNFWARGSANGNRNSVADMEKVAGFAVQSKD